MKRIGAVLGVLFLFLGFSLANAQTGMIWQEDFNQFTSDYTCCRNDCGGGLGFSERHANAMCGGDGCNAMITTLADRDGVANGRGIRYEFTDNCFPTGENIFKKDLGVNLKKFYLRWYERNSINRFTNFHKLFRLSMVGSQVLIPEWQVNSNHVQMNMGIPYPTSGGHVNNFFPAYNLDTDYVPGTWVCYELMMDILGKRSQFWVNGTSKGILENLPMDPNWYVRYVAIGGNQYGGGLGNWRDYDNVAVSTEYIGPIETTPPVCVPGPTLQQTINCPAGYTGTIVQEKVSTCPGPVYPTNWSTKTNTCESIPVCTPEPKRTQTVPCPSGQVGTGIVQEQISVCPGPTWLDWTEVSRNCQIPVPLDCLKPSTCDDPDAIWQKIK